jgi:DNA-binding transcriptional MerR regulator
MSEPDYTKSQEQLEKADVQRSIRQRIQKGRSEVAVPISKAADLFGFSEHQLRDWEKLHLLKPLRREKASQKEGEPSPNKDIPGRRYYPVAELDKLAIIRELMDRGLSPSDIPPDIDLRWQNLVETYGQLENAPESQESSLTRIENFYRENLFFRYYMARALLFSLAILYQDAPPANIGMLLPVKTSSQLPEDQNSQGVGKVLVGWLGQMGTFYTFLSSDPAADIPSHYHLKALPALNTQESREKNTILVAMSPQSARTLNLEDSKHINLIHRLLAPIFAIRTKWDTYFGFGMRDLVSPGRDTTSQLPDVMLDSIAEMVVHLGGKTKTGEQRWPLCYIVLPENTHVPVPQRKLFVCATSKNCRELAGFRIYQYNHSLILRAYLGSHVVSRSTLAHNDITLLHNPAEQELQGDVRASIAVPIGGENQTPLGVLYVAASDYAERDKRQRPKGFSQEDLYLLRLLARLAEELLSSYTTHRKLTQGIGHVFREPQVINHAFRGFASEDEFIRDVEQLLYEIKQSKNGQIAKKANNGSLTGEDAGLSFLGVEVDRMEEIGARYSQRTMRNLSRAINNRLAQFLSSSFSHQNQYKLYYIGLGRVYLLLHDVPLEDARALAESLRKDLAEEIAVEQSNLPSGILNISITAHLGVCWYKIQSLKKLLEEAPTTASDLDMTIASVSSVIFQSLHLALRLGADKKGNVTYAWNPDANRFMRFRSSEE